jgi:hypothetical protein
MRKLDAHHADDYTRSDRHAHANSGTDNDPDDDTSTTTILSLPRVTVY